MEIKAALPIYTPFHVYKFLQTASWPNLPEYIRCLHPNFIRDGWSKTIEPMIEQDRIFAPEAVIVHLPFGKDPGRDYDFAAFTTAKKDPRLSKVTDIDEFTEAWVNYSQKTGIKKIYFYYGYVGADASLWNALKPYEFYNLIAENISPIASVKSRGVEAGIIIDNTSAKNPANVNFTVAYPAIKESGLAIGGEAWPAKDNPYLADKDFIHVATEDNLWWMDPSLDPNNHWAATLKEMKGPLIPIMRAPNWEAHEVTALRATERLKKYHWVAYENFTGFPKQAKDLYPKLEAHPLAKIDPSL